MARKFHFSYSSDGTETKKRKPREQHTIALQQSGTILSETQLPKLDQISHQIESKQDMTVEKQNKQTNKQPKKHKRPL